MRSEKNFKRRLGINPLVPMRKGAKNKIRKL